MVYRPCEGPGPGMRRGSVMADVESEGSMEADDVRNAGIVPNDTRMILPRELEGEPRLSPLSPLRGAFWTPQDGLTTEERKRKKIAMCPLRPIFVSLAVIGQVSIQLTPPYFPSKHLFRSTFLYCIVMNIIVSISAFQLIGTHLPQIFEVDILRHLSSRLKCVNALLAMGPLSLLPMVWCLCCDYNTKVLRFIKFQLLHEEMTGEEWDCKPHNHRNRTFTSMLFVSNLAVFGTMAYFADIPPESFPAYLTSSLVCHNITLWYVTWLRILRDGGERILRHLKTPRKGHSASHIQGVRKLWIKLRDNLEAGVTMRSLITLILGFMFLVLTLSLYQIIQLKCQGLTNSAIRQAIVCFSMFILIFFLCNESHLCAAQLNEEFIRGLDHISLNATGEEACKAIQLFYLSITAKPAGASLLGFMNCNRQLMSTIVSATITYLVVLIQFHS